MKSIFLCVGLLSLTSVSCGHAAETVALFNGHDLSGWTFDVKDDADPKSIWSVQDGVLVCDGKPSGVIRTSESYSNYELTLEWRWAPGTEGGNSGCLIHCSSPRQLDIWPKCIEVQLMKGNAGDFYMLGETIDAPEAQKDPQGGRRIRNLTDNSERPIGEWNTLRVRCQGDQVAVWVNGDKVNEGTHCSANQGAICLQSEGAEIHFRKVELTRLD